MLMTWAKRSGLSVMIARLLKWRGGRSSALAPPAAASAAVTPDAAQKARRHSARRTVAAQRAFHAFARFPRPDRLQPRLAVPSVARAWRPLLRCRRPRQPDRKRMRYPFPVRMTSLSLPAGGRFHRLRSVARATGAVSISVSPPSLQIGRAHV